MSWVRRTRSSSVIADATAVGVTCSFSAAPRIEPASATATK
jgi:hypothetical protein